jgi:hypothetical protein
MPTKLLLICNHPYFCWLRNFLDCKFMEYLAFAKDQQG